MYLLDFLHLFCLIPQQRHPPLAFLHRLLPLLQNSTQGCISQKYGSHIQQCSVIIFHINFLIFLLSYLPIQLLSFLLQAILQLFNLKYQLDFKCPIEIKIFCLYIFQSFCQDAIYLVFLTNFPSQFSIRTLYCCNFLSESHDFPLHFLRAHVLLMCQFDFGSDSHLGKQLGILLPGNLSPDTTMEQVETTRVFRRQVVSGFAEAGSRRHMAQIEIEKLQ